MEKEIAKAFISAQNEMSNATKNAQNPFLKNKYADLNSVREAVIPVLNKHGIAVLQPIVTIEGKSFVKTILLHESGQTIEGLCEIVFARANDAQAQGSGITYARRYGLQSLVCIGADDDDGNKASQTPPINQSPKNAKKPVFDQKHPQWESLLNLSPEQKKKLNLEYFRQKYTLSEDVENEILIILKTE